VRKGMALFLLPLLLGSCSKTKGKIPVLLLEEGSSYSYLLKKEELADLKEKKASFPLFVFHSSCETACSEISYLYNSLLKKTAFLLPRIGEEDFSSIKDNPSPDKDTIFFYSNGVLSSSLPVYASWSEEDLEKKLSSYLAPSYQFLNTLSYGKEEEEYNTFEITYSHPSLPTPEKLEEEASSLLILNKESLSYESCLQGQEGRYPLPLPSFQGRQGSHRKSPALPFQLGQRFLYPPKRKRQENT
jgi:hypothetical protein